MNLKEIIYKTSENLRYIVTKAATLKLDLIKFIVYLLLNDEKR